MAQPPRDRALPARGVLAGIKEDLKRAKQSGSAYDPRGVGSAWSHAFLNQKPWHPQNFRNQIRLFDAEQRAAAEEKSKQEGLQEFEAEQEYLKTLSYLSPEEQQRYRERQSVSWMYSKPPGLEAALAAQKGSAPGGSGAAAGPSTGDAGAAAGESTALAAGPSGGSATGDAAGGLALGGPLAAGQGKRERELDDDKVERARGLDKVREDPFAAMLAARMALQRDERFVLKHGGGECSPPRGGVDRGAANQQLLPDGSEVEELLAAESDQARTDALLAGLSEKERKKVLKLVRKAEEAAEREARVREAERVLREAGVDVEAALGKGEKGKKKKKHKKEHREEGEGKHKKHKH